MNPSMDHPQGFLDSQGCLESLAGFLYQFYKLFCGAMIGSAFLFPLANTGEFWFRAITLLIFVLAAVAFHGLYLEPFVRYGLYVYPASMMFLLLHVFKTEYLEMDITPWLPLFIVCSSLSTMGVHKILLNLSSGPSAVFLPEEFSGVAIESDSSSQASSQQWHGPPSQSSRLNQLFFARHGPLSHYSSSTGSQASDITLSRVVGQFQPHWDPLTQSHFTKDTTMETNLEIPGQSHYRVDLGQEVDNDSAPDHLFTGSNYPLLPLH